MHRTAPRLARLLTCATVVPVALVAGCSSPPEEKSSDGDRPKPSSTVAAAKYDQLPKPCDTIGGKTVKKLVPHAKDDAGSAGKSSDLSLRGNCAWNGLDGYQYRWLDVSLQRFESIQALGSGEKRATAYYAKAADDAKKAPGAKNVHAGTDAKIGDQATTVRYETKKDGDTFKNQTIVVRTANVVLILDYNGAGYEDAKSPDAAKMLDYAESAAREAVAATADANAGSGSAKS